MSTGWRKAFMMVVVITGLSVVVTQEASAQNVIFPGSPLWSPDNRGAGTVDITGLNPRSGNGSLELMVNGSLTDWGFFRRVSGDSLTTSWGFVSAVTRLSFDWYRQSLSTSTNDIPWLAQTPVLRLFLRQGTGAGAVFSELVWEKFYTDNSPAVTDQWVVQNTMNDMFWRYVQGGGYTIGDCSNVDPFFPNPLKTTTVNAWANGSNCMPTDVVVWGISVGVGSNWPDVYHGFTDNVQLGFDTDPLVVNDNFELPETAVPEPATVLLLGTGLLGLAGAGFVRRRKASGR